MAVIVSADPIRADAPMRQFSRSGVAVVWAAAAVPMGLLAPAGGARRAPIRTTKLN
jgi:hypothetical protein